ARCATARLGGASGVAGGPRVADAQDPASGSAAEGGQAAPAGVPGGHRLPHASRAGSSHHTPPGDVSVGGGPSKRPDHRSHRGGKDVYCVRSGPGGLSPRVSGTLLPHVAVLGRDRPGKSGWLLSFVGKTVGSDPCQI